MLALEVILYGRFIFSNHLKFHLLKFMAAAFKIKSGIFKRC